MPVSIQGLCFQCPTSPFPLHQPQWLAICTSDRGRDCLQFMWLVNGVLGTQTGPKPQRLMVECYIKKPSNGHGSWVKDLGLWGVYRGRSGSASLKLANCTKAESREPEGNSLDAVRFTPPAESTFFCWLLGAFPFPGTPLGDTGGFLLFNC